MVIKLVLHLNTNLDLIVHKMLLHLIVKASKLLIYALLDVAFVIL